MTDWYSLIPEMLQLIASKLDVYSLFILSSVDRSLRCITDSTMVWSLIVNQRSRRSLQADWFIPLATKATIDALQAFMDEIDRQNVIIDEAVYLLALVNLRETNVDDNSPIMHRLRANLVVGQGMLFSDGVDYNDYVAQIQWWKETIQTSSVYSTRYYEIMCAPTLIHHHFIKTISQINRKATEVLVEDIHNDRLIGNRISHIALPASVYRGDVEDLKDLRTMIGALYESNNPKIVRRLDEMRLGNDYGGLAWIDRLIAQYGTLETIQKVLSADFAVRLLEATTAAIRFTVRDHRVYQQLFIASGYDNNRVIGGCTVMEPEDWIAWIESQNLPADQIKRIVNSELFYAFTDGSTYFLHVVSQHYGIDQIGGETIDRLVARWSKGPVRKVLSNNGQLDDPRSLQ